MKQLYSAVLFFIALAGAGLPARAQQTTTYETELATTKGLYESGLYDRAILSATTLLTMDPDRGEGYVLTALLFARQNDPDKARAMLAQAKDKRITDPVFTVAYGQRQLDDKQELDRLLAGAQNAVAAKDPLKAARFYTEAFHKNQEANLEYALEALSLLLDQKDYLAAVPLLEQLRESKNPEVAQNAAELLGRVAEQPEVKREKQYQSYVRQGETAARAERFAEAISYYRQATQLKSSADITQRITDAQDDLAYEKARASTTIEASEDYKQKYPRGRHIPAIDRTLQQSYLSIARGYSKEGNVEKAEEFYQRYLTQFPAGADAPTAQTELCNTYVTEARRNEKIKTVSGASRAAEMYKKALACQHPQVKSGMVARLENKATRWQRPDVGYLGWNADADNLLGMSTGSLNTRSIGWYFSGRLGGAAIEAVSEWKTNQANSIDESEDKTVKYSGTRKARNYYFTLGLNKKILHPLWLYAGAGVNVSDELREFENSSSRSEWVLNKDAHFVAFNPEIGVQLVLGSLYLRGGINKPLTNKYTGGLIKSFGIGFTMD